MKKQVLLTFALIFSTIFLTLNAQISFVEDLSTSFTGAGQTSIAYADIDGDNDQDVLVTGSITSSSNIAELYRNDGSGNFMLILGTPFPGVRKGSVAFADIDGDNDQDVMISGITINNPEVTVTKLYRNDGTGNFNEIMGTPFVGARYCSVAFADVDGDNDQDVFIAGEADQIPKLYTNDGNGNFTLDLSTSFMKAYNVNLAVGDIDNDNDLDLIISGFNNSSPSGGKTRLYTNDGNGNFTMTPSPFADVYTGSIDFADIDNDNDQDVLITGALLGGGSVAKLYTNDGNGNFVEVIGTPFQAVSFSSAAFADIDNDNDQDVLIAGTNGSRISELFVNDGFGNYTLESGVQFEGMSQGSLAFFDADNDSDQDVLLVGSGSVTNYMANLYFNETTVTYTFNNGVWSPNNPSGGASGPDDDIVIMSGNATLFNGPNLSTSCNSLTVEADASVDWSGRTLYSQTIPVFKSTSTTYSSFLGGAINAGPGSNNLIVYERYVNSTANGNDLIASTIQYGSSNFSIFLNTGDNAINLLSDGNVPATYAFAPFDKSVGQYVNISSPYLMHLIAGKGYRAATVSGSTLSFQGSPFGGNYSVDIVNEGPIRQKWNLVGNSYPSYLKVQDFLTHEVDPGVRNLDLFDPSTAAIYGYDGSATNGWTIYNLATISSSTLIAPGQGFFVSADASKVNDHDLEFRHDMRAPGTSDDFILGRNAELIYLKLGLITNSNTSRTDFYFNQNATQGLDVGYDAETFDDTNLYSHLIQDNEGKAIALQALNPSDLSDVSIPLGVQANQGEQITFSISESTLPESVNVYLDDVVANTSTLLNTNDYVITPTTNLSGTGRFFLRTSEDALSTIENDFDTLNIFALNSSKVIVVGGLLKESANLVLYDIQGRQVLVSKLDTTTLDNRIDVSLISGGVYIVTIESNTQQKTQKIVLK